MTDLQPSTPLAALGAVVLDTETTGLDPAEARLVQLGAVKIDHGGGALGHSFETLVNPGVPIPEASTGIHGISDADVAAAPGFGDAMAALHDFIGGRPVIGYAIGYDMEVLACEAARAGVTWSLPRTLDVRPLSQFVLDGSDALDLEGLADRLGIVIEGRHTAIGDARATARIFAALVPLLRERGVRTFAEAENVQRRIAARGAPATDNGTVEDTGALERIDSYPYRHRVADVMRSPPVLLTPDATLREAASVLLARRTSSVFFENSDGTRGILTERDVLRALDGHGEAAFAMAISRLGSVPLTTVRDRDMMYRAIGRMDRFGIRHLGVIDGDGALVGAVTTRNLLRHRADTAMILGDQIAAARRDSELAAAWAQAPQMVERLLAEELDPRRIAGVISTEIRMLTRRAAEFAEARMAAAGRGVSPAPYALLVLGSAGRGESLLAADQDNAIVYGDGGDDGWFAELGGYIADILDLAGIPYCKGGVMAREAAWRRDAEGWRAHVDGWIDRQSPEDLLNVDIFFDAVPVHGDRALGEGIWEHAVERGSRAPSFRRALADTLAGWRPAVGMFGTLRTGADGRADLKAGGLMPIFTAARILAIKAGARHRATPDRLRAAAAAGLASEDQIEGLIDSHRAILGAILAQQIADIRAGVSPTTRVDPRPLGRSGRAALVGALRRVPGAVDLAREGMF